MDEPKICPLLSAGRATDPVPCLESRCALWLSLHNCSTNTTVSRCAILSQADSLDGMNHGITCYNE